MKYLRVIAGLFLVISSLKAQTFVDITTQSKLTGMAGGSAAWIDFNQDGHEDLNVSNQIWINNGDHTFRQLANVSLAGSAVWADINNDGYPDAMCWVGTGHLFLNQQGKSLLNISDNLPDLPTRVSLAAAMGDFNGDRLVDLYVGGYEGPGYLTDVMYFNQGDNTFKEVWRTEGTTMPARGITTADYDEDGDLDIYVSNYRLVPNTLWNNDGKGKFTQVEKTAKVDGDGGLGAWGHTIGSSWGDLDNDGHLDLFVGNFSHPPAYQDRAKFLRNMGKQGAFIFADQTANAGLQWQESFASPALGDYDNDGLLDLYFTTVYGGDHCVLYKNADDFKFKNVTEASGIKADTTYQAAWGDFDNDGDLDLVTKGRLYENTSPPKQFVKIKLVGTGLTDSMAFGSQVRITVNDHVQTRQVCSSTGQGNQNSSILHFGLGSYTGPLKAEVAWLGGTRTMKTLKINALNVIRPQ
ncbi:MAG: CRTAC1 family protein [Planctomycetota bacterium]|nr:CRTAC1 family protein [Planctomycetota bacterium]